MKRLSATMSILALVPVERIVAEDTDARVPAVERAVDPQPGDSGSVPVRLREEQHYPLHQSGGLAVPSADLEEYLKTLQARATARTFLLTFHDVLFEPDSARISEQARSDLARLAEFLLAHPDTMARIIGHE